MDTQQVESNPSLNDGQYMPCPHCGYVSKLPDDYQQPDDLICNTCDQTVDMGNKAALRAYRIQRIMNTLRNILWAIFIFGGLYIASIGTNILLGWSGTLLAFWPGALAGLIGYVLYLYVVKAK